MEFTGNIIIAVLDNKGNSGIYSTVKEINDMESDAWQGGVPSIAIRRTYNPKDQLVESFEFSIKLIGWDPSTIRNIQVLSSFDYLLTETLQIEMKGLL